MINKFKNILLTQVSEGFVIFLTILFIFLVYAFFLQYRHENIFIPTKLNYYSDLLNSFLEGRLDVASPINNDLSLFNGKWYLYWGPAPTLFILPFRLLLGLHPGDIFYTATAGLMNVVLFYFVVNEFSKYFKLKLSTYSKIFILLSFGICSPNIYTSLQGMIWYTSQTIACFYLLIFFLFYFKFLNNPKNLLLFSLSVLFFCLSWFSRVALVFHGMLLLYPLLILKDKVFKKIIMSLVVLIGFFIFLDAIYNLLRFDNFFETGLTYHFGDSRYSEIIKQKKFLSFDYLPANFNYYFLDFFKLSPLFPFIVLDREANSIFAIYPTTLLLFFSFSRRIYKDFKKRIFFILGLMTIISELALLLIYFATGGPQFGLRYFLDLAPLTFLLILFNIERINPFLKVGILFLGIIINIFGIVTFK